MITRVICFEVRNLSSLSVSVHTSQAENFTKLVLNEVDRRAGYDPLDVCIRILGRFDNDDDATECKRRFVQQFKEEEALHGAKLLTKSANGHPKRAPRRRRLTDDEKRRISERQTGRKLSDERRAAISRGLQARRARMLGLHTPAPTLSECPKDMTGAVTQAHGLGQESPAGPEGMSTNDDRSEHLGVTE